MSTAPAGGGPSGSTPVDVGSPTVTEGFDPDLPYRISASVSVRPESFGALVYDFGTRRLSFLKTRPLVRVVEGLADHHDVHGALDAAEVPEAHRRRYLEALAGLAAAGTIERRHQQHGEQAS